MKEEKREKMGKLYRLRSDLLGKRLHGIDVVDMDEDIVEFEFESGIKVVAEILEARKVIM